MGAYEGEQECINMTGERVSFEIAIGPGVKPMRYMLEPGQTVTLAKGYCVPRGIPGPDREQMPSIIESLTQGRVKPTSAPDAQARSAAVKAAMAEAMSKLQSAGKLPGLDPDAKVPAEAPTGRSSGRSRMPAGDADAIAAADLAEQLEDVDFEVPSKGKGKGK